MYVYFSCTASVHVRFRDGMLQVDDAHEDVDTDESLLVSAEKWEPDPIDADSSLDASSQDVISMLVGIYGSKELFINEYR